MDGHRQRLARHSVSTTPLRGSPLARSPSTPYDVYRAQHHEPAGGMRFGSGSRFTSGSAYSTPQTNGTPGSSVFASPSSPNTYAAAVYRRNVGFGSPGVSAMRGSPRPSQGHRAATGDASSEEGLDRVVGSSSSRVHPRTSNRFVRRKTLKQRLMEFPRDLYDKIVFSEYLDFGNPALGYPLGIAMHALSLLVLMTHPDGSLHVGRPRSVPTRPNTLFADPSVGGLASRRRVQKDSAWRVTAGLMAFLLLVAAIVNAVHLFTARRRYQLWLKSTRDSVQSTNANLVDIPAEVDAPRERSLHEIMADAVKGLLSRTWRLIWWTTKKILWRMRSLSYIGVIIRILFPLFSRVNNVRQGRHSSSFGQQMHVLDMWQAPEVPLRIFSLYSPLHAVIYLGNINALPFVHLQPSTSSTFASRFSAFLAGAVIMAVFSAQTILLVQSYTDLIKDKSIVAGEVLHEYDQKFVMPRAMPVCRDASTMTTQAETIDTSEWMQSMEHDPPESGEQGAQFFPQERKPEMNSFHSMPGFGRSTIRANASAQATQSPPRKASTPRRKGRQTTGV